MNAIEVSTITKKFSAACAVDSVSFSVEKGELFGLVGPDGAGKTTLMRILASVMTPDSGDALVAGHSVSKEPERVKEKIGYMSQKFGLYEDLTVLENILFYADLYDVAKKERPARIEKLLGFSNLKPFQNRLAGKLSGGMKQKLGLACALIHTPEVLFLDEPTNGVDPVSRRDFWKILSELKKEGVTVFVSTSYLDEAERCGKVILFNTGKVMMNDSPAALKERFGFVMYEVETEHARKFSEIILAGNYAVSATVYGTRVHIALRHESDTEKAVSAAESAGIQLKSMKKILPSIEDIFIAGAAHERKP